MYSNKIMEIFKSPTNAGAMRESDAIGTVYSSVCSDVMKFFIVVDADTKVITSAKFQVFGCVAAFAVGSITAKMMEGKTVDEVLEIQGEDILKEVGELPHEKVYLTDLAKQTIEDAIADYQRKQARLAKNTVE